VMSARQIYFKIFLSTGQCTKLHYQRDKNISNNI
jgi:hypothetical protein